MPYNKLWRLNNDDIHQIKLSIKNGLKGDFTKKFENNFAKKFKNKFAIAVNSGTSALHVALLALGIKKDDEVIVPPLTFIATSFAPLYLGAVPVFADIEKDTFNIDPDDIIKKITNKTKAIIAVSIYGLPANLVKIKRISRDYNLKIIEDNAECIFGKSKGKLAGTFGDISIYSFQRSKHLTTGDGGMLITNSAKYAEIARKYSDLGYRGLTAKPITNEDLKSKMQHYSYKRHELVGYNYRMPEFCAAVGISQLNKMKILLQKRIKIAKIYEEVIKNCKWLIPQKIPLGYSSSYWTYVVRIEHSKKNCWDLFRKLYLHNGGDSFYGAWSLSYLEPALYKKKFGNNQRYIKGLCPVAEEIQPRLMQFKTNYKNVYLAYKQAALLKKTIKEFN